MQKKITNNPFFIYTILVFLFSVIYLSSCDDNPADSSKDIVLPDSNLNYTEHIFPLFTVKCGSENGCHSPNFGGLPAKGLDLTNYQSIISHRIDGSEPLVIEYEGEISFLYNILLSPISGRRQMPPDREPLSINNIIGVKTWIDEGAHQFAQPD